MSHTPGPWRVELCECSDGDLDWQEWAVTSVDGNPICAEVLAEANARLIAAAPEAYGLLVDLRDVIARVENGDYVDLSDYLVRIRDVLLKARRGL